MLLEDQDRARWDRGRIDEGRGARSTGRCACGRSGRTSSRRRSPRSTTTRATAGETDWAQIAALYAALGAVAPSPVVELNRAVAVAMATGPERGLRLRRGVAATGQLDDYPYLHAARADLLRRLGRLDEAGAAYERARELTANEAERAFLDRRSGPRRLRLLERPWRPRQSAVKRA